MFYATALLAASLAQGRDAPTTAADVLVAVYFDRSDPRSTFRWQAYDLRRGEFTPEVDAWLARVRGDYPHYRAYLLDVTLADWPGSTPGERLAAAVESERLGATLTHLRAREDVPARPAPEGYAPIQFSFGPSPPELRDLAIGLPAAYRRDFGPPLGASGAMASPSAPFPVPMPYPRPHP